MIRGQGRGGFFPDHLDCAAGSLHGYPIEETNRSSAPAPAVLLTCGFEASARPDCNEHLHMKNSVSTDVPRGVTSLQRPGHGFADSLRALHEQDCLAPSFQSGRGPMEVRFNSRSHCARRAGEGLLLRGRIGVDLRMVEISRLLNHRTRMVHGKFAVPRPPRPSKDYHALTVAPNILHVMPINTNRAHSGPRSDRWGPMSCKRASKMFFPTAEAPHARLDHLRKDKSEHPSLRAETFGNPSGLHGAAASA